MAKHAKPYLSRLVVPIHADTWAGGTDLCSEEGSAATGTSGRCTQASPTGGIASRTQLNCGAGFIKPSPAYALSPT